MEEDFIQSVKRSNATDQATVGHRFEQYHRDESVLTHSTDGADVDPILEMCITDSDINSEEESHSLVTTNKPKLPSPDREFMDELVKPPNGGTDIQYSPSPKLSPLPFPN